MAKTPINEGIVDRLIERIFELVAHGKQSAIEKRFKSDPELIKLTRTLAVLREKIAHKLAKLEKDPIASKYLDNE